MAGTTGRARVVLLGGFDARLGSGEALTLPTRKTEALLAYLALTPGQPHPRGKLATLLWGDTPDAQARASLRQSLAALKKALSPAAPAGVLVTAKTISLHPEALDVDVRDLERLTAEGTPSALEQAAALYRGELLEGFDRTAAPFEDWLLGERERLREVALTAMARLLRQQSDAGATDRAIQTAIRLLAVDPLQEPVHRTLMRLYARQGRRANALRQYQVCVDILQRELGLAPEPETRQTYTEVLRQRSVLGEAPGPGSARAARPPRGPVAQGVDYGPLVGRGAEMARLSAAVHAALAGRGTTAVIVGEAGVGKTRLVEEVSATGREQGCRVVVGRCYETEQILPFGPWVEVLRGAGSTAAPALEALDAASRSELARLLPELAEAGARSKAAPDDFLRLFEAVAELVRAVAARQPLILILEDLHWGDEMTVRLFGFLARRLEATAALLVATAREEELEEAAVLRRLLEELRGRGRDDVVSLTLSPLSEPETRLLVQALAPAGAGETSVARIAGDIWNLSEGNPFVVVEAMRALVEGQTLEASAVAVPARVRQVIGDRLDRLSAPAADLLAVAAVIGREFEFGLPQRAAGMGEEEGAESLEELVRRRVLHVVGERIDFVHDRIREVAYARLLPPRRKRLHAAVGAALEASDRVPHHAALGLHYRLGQVWDKAVIHLREAGGRAVACSASRDAIAFFEQALEALEHLPDGPSRREQEFDLRIYLQAACWNLGDLARIIDHLEQAKALARVMGDDRRLARASGFLSACLTTIADQPHAIEEGTRALALAEQLNDFPVQIVATFFLGLAAMNLGEFPRALELMDRNTGRLQGELRFKRLGHVGLPSVFALAWATVPLRELGRLGEATARGEEALAIAEASEHPYTIALASWALGSQYCAQQEPGRGIPLLERSVELSRAHELAVLSPMASWLGHAYALCGRLAEALLLLEEGVKRAESVPMPWAQARGLVHLGEAYLRAGRVEDAGRAAEGALSVAEKHSDRATAAHALRLLGAIASSRGSTGSSSARQYLCRALSTAESLGMQPLVARCRLELGQLV